VNYCTVQRGNDRGRGVTTNRKGREAMEMRLDRDRMKEERIQNEWFL
jgi:hypothetical protein